MWLFLFNPTVLILAVITASALQIHSLRGRKLSPALSMLQIIAVSICSACFWRVLEALRDSPNALSQIDEAEPLLGAAVRLLSVPIVLAACQAYQAFLAMPNTENKPAADAHNPL
jgi:hypothetical protein